MTDMTDRTGNAGDRAADQSGDRTCEVYLTTRDQLPSWYPEGQSIAVLPDGIALSPEKPLPAGEEFLRHVLRSDRGGHLLDGHRPRGGRQALVLPAAGLLRAL